MRSRLISIASLLNLAYGEMGRSTQIAQEVELNAMELGFLDGDLVISGVVDLVGHLSVDLGDSGGDGVDLALDVAFRTVLSEGASEVVVVV